MLLNVSKLVKCLSRLTKKVASILVITQSTLSKASSLRTEVTSAPSSLKQESYAKRLLNKM